MTGMDDYLAWREKNIQPIVESQREEETKLWSHDKRHNRERQLPEEAKEKARIRSRNWTKKKKKKC